MQPAVMRSACADAGSLTRDFKHLAVDMYLVEEEGAKKLKVDAHFSKRKQLAAIRTTCSHVQVLGHLYFRLSTSAVAPGAQYGLGQGV